MKFTVNNQFKSNKILIFLTSIVERQICPLYRKIQGKENLLGCTEIHPRISCFEQRKRNVRVGKWGSPRDGELLIILFH